MASSTTFHGPHPIQGSARDNGLRGGDPVFHSQHIPALLIHQHGGLGYHGHQLRICGPDLDRDILSRQQQAVGIVEPGTHRDGAGGRIHPVVYKNHLACFRKQFISRQNQPGESRLSPGVSISRSAFFIGTHVQFPHYKDPPDACQPENHPVVTMDFLSKFAEALQKKISGAIIGFMWPKITYWLPRVLIIGFAASMAIPAPTFIASMENAENI
jgi:hypothetical protein